MSDIEKVERVNEFLVSVARRQWRTPTTVGYAEDGRFFLVNKHGNPFTRTQGHDDLLDAALAAYHRIVESALLNNDPPVDLWLETLA
ncbi:hypothetical protein [Promicromonospora sp. NPDC023987]|uniref:hypothetical protein n=1 Tax=Promicromonospora sp. NPDC023987 TaxID=3155360 RepID=UPI0033D75BB1